MYIASTFCALKSFWKEGKNVLPNLQLCKASQNNGSHTRDFEDMPYSCALFRRSHSFNFIFPPAGDLDILQGHDQIHLPQEDSPDHLLESPPLLPLELS